VAQCGIHRLRGTILGVPHLRPLLRVGAPRVRNRIHRASSSLVPSLFPSRGRGRARHSIGDYGALGHDQVTRPPEESAAPRRADGVATSEATCPQQWPGIKKPRPGELGPLLVMSTAGLSEASTARSRTLIAWKPSGGGVSLCATNVGDDRYPRPGVSQRRRPGHWRPARPAVGFAAGSTADGRWSALADRASSPIHGVPICENHQYQNQGAREIRRSRRQSSGERSTA
jgi:hypothetical protein